MTAWMSLLPDISHQAQQGTGIQSCRQKDADGNIGHHVMANTVE